jgi:methyl-accepting chemotaxis protein
MSNGHLGWLPQAVRSSIRGQLLALLIGMLFGGAVLLAIVFYFQAKISYIKQLEDTSKLAGTMMADLSAYDFQFNRAGLKTTLTTFVKSDSNILWAEFVDAKGATIEMAPAVLKKAPYVNLGEAISKAPDPAPIQTDSGEGRLIRVPVIASAAAGAGSAPDLGFGETGGAGPATPTTLGELRVVVGMRGLSQLGRSYALVGAFIVLATLLLGSVISVGLIRYLLAPVERMTTYAQKIAEGNLAATSQEVGRADELGRLAGSFQNMSSNLASMVRQVRAAFQAMQGDTESVRKVLNANLESNRGMADSTREVADRTAAIQKSAETVSALMEGLSQIAEEVSSSVIEMISNIEEIAGNTEGLNEAVNTSATTLTQSVAATRQIAASVDTLNRFVEDTSSAMTQMEGSIRQVDTNAAETRKATETVLREAQEGARFMERSEVTIGQLQSSFASTVGVMRNLDQKSEEVGSILSVIDEVMEQTHLLALNAAIIAAQAGEHGKSFAVVAGEIRALAEKTSLSTREIATLIESVQKEVQRAVDAVSAQTDLVDQSVSVAQETRAALDRIQGSVQTSMRMVQEIARATAEQAKGASGIVRSSEQVRDLTHQLKRATQEQRSGSEQILGAVNRIRGLAEEAKRATREQTTGSSIIRTAMDNLTSSVGKVMSQTRSQTEASKDVEKLMGGVSSASRSNVSGLQGAVEQMEALSRRAEELGHELARFRTES